MMLKTHVDFRRLRVGTHAILEARKDFSLNSDNQAREWITGQLRRATFIDTVIGKDGQPGRLYGHKRTVFVLAQDEDYVITVYKNDNPASFIQRKVNEMVTKELRKLQRKESVIERKIECTKAELAVEKAQLQLRLLRAKSPSTKIVCQARINAIDEYYTQLDADLLAVKHEKRAVAKTVVAYM